MHELKKLVFGHVRANYFITKTRRKCLHSKAFKIFELSCYDAFWQRALGNQEIIILRLARRKLLVVHWNPCMTKKFAKGPQ